MLENQNVNGSKYFIALLEDIKKINSYNDLLTYYEK